MLINENKYNLFKQHHPLESLKAAQARDVLFKKFNELSLPHKKQEAWKFTSLQSLKNVEWNFAIENDSDLSLLSHEEMTYVSKKCHSDFHNLIFVNGKLNKTLSESDIAFEVREFTAEDLTFHEKDVEVYFTTMSQVFSAQKIKFNFTKAEVIEKPIQIISVVSQKENTVLNLNFEINLAERADVKIIFHQLSLSSQVEAQHLINTHVNTQLHESSHLKLVYIDNNSSQNYHFSQVKFDLENSSRLVFVDLCLGSQLSRHYMQTRFKGELAEAGLYAVNLLADTQHTDHYTFIWHEKGQNNSIQHYKSILGDKSHSVFRGRIKIDPLAQKANSEQLNNNLLLSSAASADSVPQLEIFADDVKAGHGSTIGQLNKEEIFYFLSRGISQSQALKMLSYGYAKELVFKLENTTIENYLFSILEEKLEEMF